MEQKKIFALGFFDGVHLGHQELLRRCRELAKERSCGTAAITFDRHPQSLFVPNPPPLISTAESRSLLLRHYGMEEICQLPVVKETMSMSWRDFLQVLLDRGAAGFVCGEDFRFGSRGEGDIHKLQELCQELNLPCVIVPEQTMDGQRISSTQIRSLIESGQMEEAVRRLGHPHILTGTVVHGKRLGRTLGIPTANLLLPSEMAVPKFGVYACRCNIGGDSYAAVANVGTRPTVNGVGMTVEPWILDFEGDLYEQEITLQFHKFLRPEIKFPNLDALKAEIHKNAKETRRCFREETP